MEVTVKLNNLRRSPGKIRSALYLIKGKNANQALDILRFTQKGCAPELAKLVKAAIAAAGEREMKAENLIIKIVKCDGAGMYKRHRFGSRGRSVRIEKRNSHLTLTVTDELAAKAAKPAKEVKETKEVEEVKEVAEAKSTEKEDKVVDNKKPAVKAS